MSFSRQPCWLLCLLLTALPLSAAEHIIALGADLDSEDSKAFSVAGNFAVADETWLSASLGNNHSPGELFDLNAIYLDAGIDHYFNPIGVRVAAAYWGDADLLDSQDLRGSLYWRGDRGSLAIDLERRDFDLAFEFLLSRDVREVEFSADGIGASLRLKLNDALSVYANGMRYDYSRNLAVQPNIDVLRIFALSSLSTVNSLLDDRVSGGLEYSFGARVLDVRASSWRTAVFGDRVDSIGVGLLTPLGNASDLELRLSLDDSDSAGRATLFSVYLYFYGE
jgi:hypothetical protein